MDFHKGVALGIALAMTVVTVVLSYGLRDMGAIYADLGPGVPLPLLTRMTIAAAWLVVAPLTGLASCGYLFALRPKRLTWYVLAAVVMTVVAVLTWEGPRLPLFELAGNIKAD